MFLIVDNWSIGCDRNIVQALLLGRRGIAWTVALLGPVGLGAGGA